jgi:hypothetical protein
VRADFVDLVGRRRGWRCPLLAEANIFVAAGACIVAGRAFRSFWFFPGSLWSSGGGSGLSLASFLRFWAIAASRNSSCAPQGPRNRSRPSLRIRFFRWRTASWDPGGTARILSFPKIPSGLEGGREGIEVARWLSRVCEAPIVFVTGYTDRDVDRVHEQVPGAPVLSKPVYGDRLADAVAAVIPHQH